MKIIGVGISKTGTSSLAAALKELGFRAVHGWPPWAIENADAICDVPAACRFRELDALYPGSKFILTTRERESWLKSCLRHWERSAMEAALPEVRFEYYWCRTQLFGRLDFDPENHWRSYERHAAQVRAHFAERPEDLLEIDITAGEGWEALCRFLNVPVPARPFPWKNRTPEAAPAPDQRRVAAAVNTGAHAGRPLTPGPSPTRGEGRQNAAEGVPYSAKGEARAEARLSEAFAKASGPKAQMSPAQYFRIASEVLRRAPCRLLVVGAGRDTELYVRANAGGRTVVLEHQPEWLEHIARLDCTAIQVGYCSRLSQPPLEPCPLPEGVPDWVLQEPWDVILVDSPEGYHAHAPGRQQSIFLASRLARAGTTVFLHDFERRAEQAFAARYLKQPDETYGDQPRLAAFHYGSDDSPAHQSAALPSALFVTAALPAETTIARPTGRIVERPKIFVLGVPHTQTSLTFNTCPFTVKAWYQARMFQDLGHEVIHLGVEGSDPDCAENVAVVSQGEWETAFGGKEGALAAGSAKNQGSARWRDYEERWASRVREAILERTRESWEAIVCCTWGGAQIEATKGLSQFVVESGIGYRHTWAKYRVFISYAWLHFQYGREGRHQGNGWYDVVIPNAVDPGLFDFRPADKTDELLFLGRLNNDKGVEIAIDLARRTGRRLAIVGPGDARRFLAGNPHVRHVPAVDVEGRRKLMAEAAALVCPTQYVEPLGNVALEAQASGTPVICTDWGGFTESVLHGVTGYRCRTMEQFVWAAKSLERIDPAACRQWVVENYAPDRIGPMFDEYFRMLLDLSRNGWYEERPGRTQLNWLRKRHPAGRAER